jgi:hypothetical protein
MGTFNAAAFRDKLGSLNSTQASIETLSNWCQFFRKSVRLFSGEHRAARRDSVL